MARKVCGEVVRLNKVYVSEVGCWVDDGWGSSEFRITRRLIIRRGTTGLAVRSCETRKSMLEVLINGDLWPISRSALDPVQSQKDES